MDFTTNSLEEHWMPFTPNREFKEEPRLVEKSTGIHLIDHPGRQGSGRIVRVCSACRPDMAVGKSPTPCMRNY